MPDEQGTEEKKEEGPSLWEKGLGLAADGMEIAEHAGSELAEEVPLVASVVHGGLGLYHVANMVHDQHESDAAGQSAGEHTDFPNQDDGSYSNKALADSMKAHQKAENEGEEAQEQFLEAIPLLGTAVGLGGTIAHAINPSINPAKMLFGGKAENQSPDTSGSS